MSISEEESSDCFPGVRNPIDTCRIVKWYTYTLSLNVFGANKVIDSRIRWTILNATGNDVAWCAKPRIIDC